MPYVVKFEDQFRQAGFYVDRILKGTKAGDLPVQAPTKFSLGINLKAAPKAPTKQTIFFDTPII